MDRYYVEKVGTSRTDFGTFSFYKIFDKKTGKPITKANFDRKALNARAKAMNIENADLEKYNIEKRGDKFIDAKGNVYTDLTDAVGGVKRFETSKEELDTKLDEYETAIKDAGAQKEKLAQGLSARRQGELVKNLTNLLQSSGGDPAQIQALEGRIKGASTRQLGDVMKDISATTGSQLAGAKKFDISAGFDLENLNMNKQQLQDAMTRFYANQALERDKIQAQLDSQPEWWESALGSLAGGVGSILGGIGTAKGLEYLMKD